MSFQVFILTFEAVSLHFPNIKATFRGFHSYLWLWVFRLSSSSKLQRNQTKMNQSKQVASLTTSRLSPLAEPFTLNRSPYQQQQPTSYSSSPLDDPFSSLLDSFRNSNMGSISKSHSVGDSGFRQETVIATLPLEIAEEKSIFEQHPSLELPSYGEFDGPLFDVSLPANSPSVTGLGYGNGVSYGIQLQGLDFHQGLFGKGNDDSDAGKFQQGNFNFCYGMQNLFCNFNLTKLLGCIFAIVMFCLFHVHAL